MKIIQIEIERILHYLRGYASKILTFGFSQIYLENHSLIRIFELRSKVGCIGKTQINLVFHSICTTFAAQ